MMDRSMMAVGVALAMLAGCKTTDVANGFGDVLGDDVIGTVASAIGAQASGSNTDLVQAGARFIVADTLVQNRLSEQELERARERHQEIVRSGKIYTEADDVAAARYLNSIVRRISQQRPPGSVDLKGYIVKDDSVNAFTTGAGYLYFNRGLMAAFTNEAQLAMVVGHEAAHVDAGHITEGATDRAKIGVLTELGSSLVGRLGLDGLGGTVAQYGVALVGKGAAAQFSQAHESEADELGLRYVLGAGYDGLQAATAFQILAEVNGANQGFFSSHPNSGFRHRALTQMARASGASGGTVGDSVYPQMLASLSIQSARSLRKDGNLAAAERILRQRTGYGTENATFYLEQGRVLMQRNTGGAANLDEAIALFEQAERLDASDPQIARELGLAYFERRGRGDALLARQSLLRYLSLARRPKDESQIRAIIETL